jgi:hypothetical protein
MPTGKQIEEFADIYAFILHAVSASDAEPRPVRVNTP